MDTIASLDMLQALELWWFTRRTFITDLKTSRIK